MTLERRLDSIETAIAGTVNGCHTCRDWRDFVIYYREADGGVSGYDGPWPTDTFACPNCGRQPKPLICITTDGRGPQ